MIEKITQSFLDQGLLGAIIVALAVVIIYLYRENKALQADNGKLRDCRTEDAKEYATKTLEISNEVKTAVGQLNDIFSKNRA